MITTFRFFKWAFVLAICCCAGRISAQANLHFIVFADTEDASIGGANLKTYTYLTSNLAPLVSKYAGLNLKVTTKHGATFNAAELDQTLTQLTVSPNDVVFFYFVGHGWNSRVNNFPSLILGNASTDTETLVLSSRNLMDVYKKIRAKNPRLAIVVGEACNKELSDEPPITSSRDVLIMKPASVDPARLSGLFNGWRGGMVLSSSQRGEYSHSDPKGGWMGVAFQNALADMYSPSSKSTLNWTTLVQEVKRRTMKTAENNEQEQTPQEFMELLPNALSKTTAVTTSQSQPLDKPKPQSNAPCAPVASYVNETALTGIREDLPLLHEIYEKIDSDNAAEYAESFSTFYKNQKPFYDKLGQMVFYNVTDLPAHCKSSLETTTAWVGSNAKEVNQRYSVIQKYAAQPNKLVQQARSDLPSIIRRLEEILEKLDK